MHALTRFAQEKLDALEAAALRRALVPTARGAGAMVERGGRRLVSFSCNDYLGLSTDPRVIAAGLAAMAAHGTGAGASRLVTGDCPLNGAVEGRLAAMKGTEAAMLFGSGYLANIGTIPALAGAGDAIFADALAHSCIWGGARLSGAAVHVFRHNDPAHLAALLAQHRPAARHALVVTETVFSMDGDRAPLGALAALAEAHGAWLMTDDAHGLGVVPADPAMARVPLQMGTLSKAAGGYGGYLCAAAPVVALLASRARSFVFTTGLPPGTLGAAAEALRIIADEPGFAARPLALARRFTAALGLPPAESPIVPLVLGAPEAALAASARLAEAGFHVAAIRPPTVPSGTARLRFAFSAAHAEAVVDRLAAAVRALA